MPVLVGSLSRDPALTYRGALQILGKYEHPVIKKLDLILGGLILGGGAAGAVAMLSPVLAPLAAFTAIWGWIEQRDEAVRLLRKALDGVSGKLMQTAGYERSQLVAAAHTTIAAAAFFETLQEYLGAKEYEKLAITEAERKALTLGTFDDLTNRRLIELLYRAPVPTPSPARGFEENIPEVRAWMDHIAETTQGFLTGLACWKSINRELGTSLVQGAVGRYRSYYLRMAATVPEFLVWASLGEHAATRNTIAKVRADVMAALAGQTGALARLENLLTLMAPDLVPAPDLCSIVNRANLGVLTESIVPEGASAPVAQVTFPTVEQIFLNPCYRLASMGDDARPADDKWWEERPLENDLDVLLASHVTAPDAVHAPLLLLGHPGAGKSLLTKVIASRLPPSAFTVIRVSLRRVHADAPVYEQIQEALNTATNGRVGWHDLAEQSSSSLRVVLLDGLDELLQAAGHRGGYLQEVADFQRRESEQQRPVIVLVTSRTVVADRFAISSGTIMIKLEDFNQEQIEAWLNTWNRVNKHAIDSGAVRGLATQTALRQLDLAKQPLLLLMLALYSADPASPDIDSTLSSADLYRRILDSFGRREVAKTITVFQSDEFENAVHEQLRRLSIAAFAMFNRGRQNVTDDELGEDLRALSPDIPQFRPGDLGQKLIGQFFFVYVAEARPHDPQDKRRSYEFLHATFGEYLISSYIIAILADTADAGMSVRHGTYRPDDELLHTLLSHQTLASRKTTLTFATQLADDFPPEKRMRILSVLETLIAKCRRRHSSDRYTGYHPVPIDHVRQLAAYSANLVLLRVVLGDGNSFNPSEIWAEDDSAMWRSTVTLWRSGLDLDGFQAITSILKRDKGLIRLMRPEEIMPAEWADLLQMRLIGDKEAESRLRFGMAAYDRALYKQLGDSWKEVVLSALIPAISLPVKSPILLTREDEQSIVVGQGGANSGFDDYGIADMLQMSSRLLFLKSTELPIEELEQVIKWMLSLPDTSYRKYSFVSYGLAFAIAAHPTLLESIPALNDASLYEVGTPLIFSLSRSPRKARLISLSEEIKLRHYQVGEGVEYTDQLFEKIESILAAYRFEQDPFRD